MVQPTEAQAGAGEGGDEPGEEPRDEPGCERGLREMVPRGDVEFVAASLVIGGDAKLANCFVVGLCGLANTGCGLANTGSMKQWLSGIERIERRRRGRRRE